jgi:hypothetical protein
MVRTAATTTIKALLLLSKLLENILCCFITPSLSLPRYTLSPLHHPLYHPLVSSSTHISQAL